MISSEFSKFSESICWYLFSVVSGNRYLPRDSNENTLCICCKIGNTFGNHTIPFTEFAEFRESNLGIVLFFALRRLSQDEQYFFAWAIT